MNNTLNKYGDVIDWDVTHSNIHFKVRLHKASFKACNSLLNDINIQYPKFDLVTRMDFSSFDSILSVILSSLN